VLALQLASVDFTYGPRRRQPARHALRSVTLEVPGGQTVALLGPNGSGKSTLLRIITGMLLPASGQARVFEQSPFEARGMLGVVFQDPGLDRHMTVWENLRDSAALYGVNASEARRRTDDLLHAMRLSDRRDALVKTLSGGLARRVDLCRALLAQPRLLILDEPTTGLDPIARREFIDHVESRRSQLGANGLTVLTSTHLIDEAERMERVLMMHEGRIVADGSPADLRRGLGARRIIAHDTNWTPPPGERDRWKQWPDGWRRDLEREDDAPAIAAELTRAGVPFSIAPPTLADAFERIAGAPLEGRALAQEAA